jgi:hypothetical protein
VHRGQNVWHFNRLSRLVGVACCFIELELKLSLGLCSRLRPVQLCDNEVFFALFVCLVLPAPVFLVDDFFLLADKVDFAEDEVEVAFDEAVAHLHAQHQEVEEVEDVVLEPLVQLVPLAKKYLENLAVDQEPLHEDDEVGHRGLVDLDVHEESDVDVLYPLLVLRQQLSAVLAEHEGELAHHHVVEDLLEEGLLQRVLQHAVQFLGCRVGLVEHADCPFLDQLVELGGVGQVDGAVLDAGDAQLVQLVEKGVVGLGNRLLDQFCQ